jgi:hypothetical protein
MAVLSIGNTFTTGDQVTATTLNNAVNGASFASGAVDGTTTSLSGGAIIVKDGAITASKLTSTSVSNGDLFIGNGTGFTKTPLTAGNGIAITNGVGSITVSAASLGTLTGTNDYMVSLDHSDTTGKTFKKSTAFFALSTGDFEIPRDKAFWCGYVNADISIKAPAFLDGNSAQVVGVRQAAVPNIALTGANYASEYADINTKINDLLAKLRTHGLIAS